MTNKSRKKSNDNLPAQEYRGLVRVASLPAACISLADLKKLYATLNSKKHEVFDKEVSDFQKPNDQSEEQFEELKTNFQRERDLTVMVYGANGEQIVANSIDGLKEDGLPTTITGIRFDSSFTSAYPNYKFLNRFTVSLDLSKTYDPFAGDPSSQPTPNRNVVEVIGPNSTWVTGVYETVLGFFKERRRRREWLHTPLFFNLCNWIVSFPAAFWLIYRIDSAFGVQLSRLQVVLRAAIYIYVAFLTQAVFRAACFALRWMFPFVELEGSISKRVRAGIGIFLSGLLIALTYDVLKAIWSS